MSTYVVRKRSKELCIGHRLIGYRGLCRNVHGHNIIVELELEGRLQSSGITVDFEEVGNFFKVLDQNWDHGFLVNNQDDAMIQFLDWQGSKYFLVQGNPTMEILASTVSSLAREFSPVIREHLKLVRVFEKGGIDNVAEYHCDR